MSNDTAATNSVSQYLDRMEMRDAISADTIDQFARWMRKNGADPATHILVLPQSFRAGIPFFRPNHVRYSAHVTEPTFVRRQSIDQATTF